jgi:hypothetical protein
MARKHEHAALLRRAHKNGTYEYLLEIQEGRCGICYRTPQEVAEKNGSRIRRLDIDHEHVTMQIRGLLCRGCNMRLRKDHKPSWLRGAADYLDFSATLPTTPPNGEER